MKGRNGSLSSGDGTAVRYLPVPPPGIIITHTRSGERAAAERYTKTIGRSSRVAGTSGVWYNLLQCCLAAAATEGAWLVGWLPVWSVDWLVGCLVGWSVDWLVGCLVG